MNRWWIYQRERFPIVGHGALIAAFSLSAVCYSMLRRGEAGYDSVDKLRRWSQQLPGRGACGLLDAAARIAGSLLAHFPDRIDAHRRSGCPACEGAAPEDGRRFTVPVP